jgi:tripartite-type tricarboxylate transporter receptor subunit TctC
LLAFFSLAVVGSANELMASGRLRLTAAFSRRRHPNYPEVPTAREQGLDTGQCSKGGIMRPAYGRILRALGVKPE